MDGARRDGAQAAPMAPMLTRCWTVGQHAKESELIIHQVCKISSSSKHQQEKGAIAENCQDF